MPKNILLVYPEIPKNTYWSYHHALPFIGKKASMPPLGLITVAAMLPSDYNLNLIDMNIEPLKDDHIKNADAVFTSSMIIQKDSLENVIEKIIKVRESYDKDIPIIAGGPYPTQYYREIDGADHFIIGEAESGVLEYFISDLEKGTAKKAYARHVIRKKPDEKKIDEKELENLLSFFREDSDIKVADGKPDISDSAVPRFDLLDIEKYGSMAVQLSRGCPFDCEFCNEPTLFGHKPRLKSSEKMIKELDTLHGLGYRGSVFVVDDNFIGSISKVKQVLTEVIDYQKKHDYPFSFFTEASINLSKDEVLMSQMRDAGFNMVFVGIETPDKEVLRSMNKLHNVDTDLLEDVKKIQGYGMEITAGFIVGNDNDPSDICDRIFDFSQQTGIPSVMAGLLTAVKGSRLYERLKKEDRLLKDSYGNNTHDFELNFTPLEGKDRQQIIDDYKNLLSRLYDKEGKNYFERCKILRSNLGPRPKASRDVGKTETRAFLYSLARQSFFKPYSSEYRKHILPAFAGYVSKGFKGHFPEDVANAIKGHHMITITHDSLEADKVNNFLYEKISYFKERLFNIEQAWQSYRSGKGELCSRIKAECSKMLYEKNIFRREAEKKIRKLPEEHRQKLEPAYQKLLNLNERISQIFSSKEIS
ncbi:DUF4070 domain-containing protein [Candidatus Woesearchaeota archaeon]|nr:DUF4070 domain-containing protein [Candidatus Woesearchaeota archaeon]